VPAADLRDAAPARRCPPVPRPRARRPPPAAAAGAGAGAAPARLSSGPPPAPEPEAQGAEREQQRHQGDVDELQRPPQRLDVGIEPIVHLAQFLADAQLLVEEAAHRRLLFGAHLVIRAALQLRQLPLGVRQTLLQALLLL